MGRKTCDGSTKLRVGFVLAAALTTALAGAPPGASAAGKVSAVGHSYIIQMSSSQMSSGLAVHLLGPLRKAFDRAGLVYRGGPEAEYVATVETSSDVGRWYGEGEARRWLYTREVLIDLRLNAESERPHDGPPRGVAARLRTPDEDRVDEFGCLVDLAVAAIVESPGPRAKRVIDGSSCARR
jgi:hypothetical protein